MKFEIPIKVDSLELAKEYANDFYEKGYQQGRQDVINTILDRYSGFDAYDEIYVANLRRFLKEVNR